MVTQKVHARFQSFDSRFPMSTEILNGLWLNKPLSEKGFAALAGLIPECHVCREELKTSDGYVWVLGLSINGRLTRGRPLYILFPGNTFEQGTQARSLDRSIACYAMGAVTWKMLSTIMNLVIAKYEEVGKQPQS